MAAAHRLMRQHGIRHLPVLEGGKLVGLLSMRDLHFIETLKDVDPEAVPVTEAMTPEPYAVTPTTSLASAISEMAERKYGSAVVTEHDKVVGVFPTTDALRALTWLLREQRKAG